MSEYPIFILHFMIPNLSFGTEIIGCFLFQKKRFFSKFLDFLKISEKNIKIIFILPMHLQVQTTIYISWIFFLTHPLNDKFADLLDLNPPYPKSVLQLLG